MDSFGRDSSCGATPDSAPHARGAADGSILALGPKGTVQFWETPVRTQLDKLPKAPSARCGNGRHISRVAFSQDSTLAAYGDSGTEGGPRFFLRDAFHGSLINKTDGEWVATLAFSTDAKMLAIADLDGVIRVMDTPTGSEIRRFRSAKKRTFELLNSSLCSSTDGRKLASGNGDTTITIWDVHAGP